jgi:hypothetical protein
MYELVKRSHQRVWRSLTQSERGRTEQRTDLDNASSVGYLRQPF